MQNQKSSPKQKDWLLACSQDIPTKASLTARILGSLLLLQALVVPTSSTRNPSSTGGGGGDDGGGRSSNMFIWRECS